MCDAELRNLEGRFNISQTWDDVYADQMSVAYVSLKDEVIAGVRFAVKEVLCIRMKMISKIVISLF